jgi:hypothetical protein
MRARRVVYEGCGPLLHAVDHSELDCVVMGSPWSSRRAKSITIPLVLGT